MLKQYENVCEYVWMLEAMAVSSKGVEGSLAISSLKRCFDNFIVNLLGAIAAYVFFQNVTKTLFYLTY